MLLLRGEASKGAGYFSFEDNSPGTITGKFSMLYFPVETEITELLDESGNDVLSNVFSDSTTIPANTTVAVTDEGKYWTSISGSVGGVNYVTA